MDVKTIEALQELGKAAAKLFNFDEGKIVMTVCPDRQNEFKQFNDEHDSDSMDSLKYSLEAFKSKLVD